MNLIKIKDLYHLMVVVLLKLTNLFPLKYFRKAIAEGIAFFAYHVSRNKRRLAEKNVSETFGENLNEERKNEIVRSTFSEYWKEVFSLYLTEVEREKFKKAKIIGLENLQSALARRNGVILWESGMFARNPAKYILHRKEFSLYQVHSEHHMGGFRGDREPPSWVERNVIKPFFENCEKRFIKDIIYISTSNSLAFTRVIQKKLKENSIICVTGDTPLGQKLITQEFLAGTKIFPTGMVSLARSTGAAILPIFFIEETEENFVLIIERPIDTSQGKSREENIRYAVSDYAALLESYLRKYPHKCKSWHYLGMVGEEHFSREILARVNK